jgi:hypothetical protein
MPTDNNQGLAKKRFDKLDSLRDQTLERVRKCAALTIPHLLPPKNYTQNDQLMTPYQGLGARAVNNLSAKLLLTLLPANEPFYRLDVDPEVIQELRDTMGDDKVKTQIEEKLATHERMGIKLIERNAYRVQLYKTLRLLIVTGNAMLETPVAGGKPVEGRLKVHRMDHYVIRRSPSGTPLEIILKEMITSEELPPEMQDFSGLVDHHNANGKIDEDNIELFTYCRFNGKTWRVFQETLGVIIEGTEGDYKPENFPFIPLTWTLTEGENYGRGICEEYLGDLMSLDGLSQNILEGAAAMAKVIFLIASNGVTNINDLTDVVNGGFAVGNKDDVSVLQVEKYADFKVALDESQRIERRLANAFLLTDSIRRDAERVTATELRLMAQDLEDALGGVYSVLSQELQYPLALRVIAQLPPLPKQVSPSIITGFDALGRGHDLQKLEGLMQFLTPLGPEAVQTWIQMDEYIARVCVSLGIDKTGLVTPADAVAAMMQQQEVQGLIEKIAPQLAEAVVGQMQGQPGGTPGQPQPQGATA